MLGILAAATLLLMVGCGGDKPIKSDYHSLQGYAQGTTFNIVYKDSSARDLTADVKLLLEKVDSSMSTYKPYSIISKFNKGDTVQVIDAMFAEVFTRSEMLFMLTNGAFDPTVKPLVNYWGFGQQEMKPIESVDSLAVDSLVALRGLDKMSLTETDTGFVLTRRAGMRLDFNAIAQGYAVDVIARMMEDKGIVNYMVELGGEVLVAGKNPQGKPWGIGIDLPGNDVMGERKLKAIAHLGKGAIATSGNYRKFYEKDGQQYSHTIDPKTGYPVQDPLMSVTIFADDAMSADGYATCCMVLGFDKARAFIKQEGIEGYLIYNKDGVLLTHTTAGAKAIIQEQ